MKYFMIILLGACVTSCSPAQIKMFTPNHVGVSHSCEWEIQKNHDIKHKPKVIVNVDWNI